MRLYVVGKDRMRAGGGKKKDGTAKIEDQIARHGTLKNGRNFKLKKIKALNAVLFNPPSSHCCSKVYQLI